MKGSILSILAIGLAAASIGGGPSKHHVKASSKKPGLRKIRATPRKLAGGEPTTVGALLSGPVSAITSPLNFLLKGFNSINEAFGTTPTEDRSGINAGSLLLVPRDVLSVLVDQGAAAPLIGSLVPRDFSIGSNPVTDAIPEVFTQIMGKARSFADGHIDNWSNSMKEGRQIIGQMIDPSNYIPSYGKVGRPQDVETPVINQLAVSAE